MMTRRNQRRACLAVLAALLLGVVSANAADPLFNPQHNIGPSYPYYDYNAALTFFTSQNDRQATIKSYRVDIPVGWHIASASIDPSTKAGCSDITSAGDASTNAEAIGYSFITLHNDDTRGVGGGAFFGGNISYLSYNAATETATLCALVTTSSTQIPTAFRTVMFQLSLTRNPDGSGTLSWDYARVPGANPAAPRSIFDNELYYTTKNTSILSSRIQFNPTTGGNYHTTAGGKTKVKFVWNPSTPGNYTFTGRYTPCGPGDPGFCLSSPATAVLPWTLAITNYPVGYHPPAVLTSPAIWSVLTGTAPLTFRWRQPATAGTDKIKGYVLTVQEDNHPATRKTFYLISDPGNAGYAAGADPCAPNGTASECRMDFAWNLLSDTNVAIPSDTTFSANLVVLYQDGHRSDGGCDDGSAAGVLAPCPDGTMPAYGSVRSDGVAYTQFLHRDTVWPLRYRKIINNSNPQGKWPGVWMVYVLLADVDGKKFEYIVWKAGATFAGTGPAVNGNNGAAVGSITFANTTGSFRWTLDAVLEPANARGVFLAVTSNNQPAYADRFDGCSAGAPINTSVGRYPCYQSHTMGRI